jgi:hypothetical protein
MMSTQAVDRLRILAAVGLAMGVTLAGVIAVIVVVVIVSFTATLFALSDGFFWGSTAVGLIVYLLSGGLAGRLAAPRLCRAGLAEGRSLYALAVAGPATVALLLNLRPVESIPPVLGVLLPVVATIAGSALGVRFAAGRRGRRRTEGGY